MISKFYFLFVSIFVVLHYYKVIFASRMVVAFCSREYSFHVLTQSRLARTRFFLHFISRVVIRCNDLSRNEDFALYRSRRRASSSLFTLFRSFVCKSFDTYLSTYVALRVLSLFSREIPLGNKIACNIIPDSPISPSASPFHLYQIPLRGVHLFFLFLSAWSAGCIFDAPSTDNVP